MNRSSRVLLHAGCLLALLANGAGALAQKQQDKTPPPEGDVRTRTNVMITTMTAGGDMPVVMTGGEAAATNFQFQIIAPEMNFESAPVKGAPYSAEAVNETVQTLADGNRIVRKSTTLVYRDSEGRTRREQNMNNVGPFATGSDSPTVIIITDPVAGTSYALDTRTHTARKLMSFAFGYGPVERTKILAPGEAGIGPAAGGGAPPLAAGTLRGAAIKRVEPTYPDIAKAAGAEGPVTVQVVVDEQGNVASAKATSGHPLLQQAAVDAAQKWQFRPTIVDGRAAKVSGLISFNFVLNKDDNGPAQAARLPKPVVESLGTQTIEGVETTGKRITTTLPAGAIGNEQPINSVTETWYSPELHAVVMSKHSDPRFGETTYRLTNINRSEPAHNLFEVPADYAIKESEPLRREFRLKQPENNQ